MKDMINHPDHYKTKNGLETIDVIEAFTEDLTGIEAVCTANAIKYICRWNKKNGIEDINKAIWYLKKLREHLHEKERPKEVVAKFHVNEEMCKYVTEILDEKKEQVNVDEETYKFVTECLDEEEEYE